MRRLPYLILAAGFIAVAGYYFGYGRATVALVVAAVLLSLGFGYFRSAGAPPPAHDAGDLGDEDLHYVCGVCGLEVRVEVMGTDRPPTHCRESMKPVASATRPPY